MPRYVVKLADNKYTEWSTITDSPVCWIMSRRDALKRFGADRVERADKHGTSALKELSLMDLIAGNRAGRNEETLALDEIIEAYKPKEGGE